LALHLFDNGSAFAKQLAIQDVWQVSDYAQPSTYATQSGTVTPNGGSHLRVGLTVRLDEGWLAFKDITLSSFSQAIAVDKDNDYTLSAQITGNIQVSGGSSGGNIIIHNNLGGQQPLWNGTSSLNGSVSAGPMNVSTNGGVDSIWLETQVVLDRGHLTFEQLSLKILGLPVTVTGGETYGAAIRVKGSLTAPSGEKAVQLGVYNNNGSTLLHTLWEKRNYHNPQAWQVQGSSFSETNNNTVRLGVMVNLDRGWLAFDGPIWTQFSPIVSDPAMNVDSAYLMTTTLNISNQQVSSQLSVQFYDSGGSAVGAPILLADTSNAGSGMTTVTAAFLPPEDATQMRFMSQAQVASGSLTYTVDELVRQVHASHIVRSTYYLVGKAIATRVAGDPEASNNGLFFFHGDHLGSASAMSYGFDDPTTTSTNELGTWMDGTLTRYLPFGEYRTEPTTELTELGYTGHHENRDIGLTYMNARFYVPTLSRFLSADTIVSDPTDPQTWNRYSYTLNNPVKFIDPTGHCASDGSTEAEACWYYLENLFCYDIDCGSNGWKDWIIVNDDSIWTMKELWDVHESLAAVKSALQSLGIDWLHTTMSGVNFSRYAGAGLSDGAIGRYTRSTHEIILTDSAFNDRTILHELGHAIDTYSPFRDLHDRYAVESGSCVICKIGKGFYFREYGRAPQTEGWADAFSAWVYQHKEGKNPSNDAWLGVDASLEPFVDWGGIYQAVEKVLKEDHVILSPTTITVPSKSHVRIPSPL
jgi:RHS repeat-associated protein